MVFLAGKARRWTGSGDWAAHSVSDAWDEAWRVSGRVDRNVRAADSGRDSRVDACIDLRRQEHAPEDLGPAPADLGFEIQHEERVKDIAGKEGDQQEALNQTF